jgi:predicted MPP superfamily phosphohydrolase
MCKDKNKMPLLRIFSDLHLEFGLGPIKKCVDICFKNRSKYIILAGDITNFKQREQNLTKLITELKPFTDRIIYILGNHEYYELGKTKACEVKAIYGDLSKKLDIDFLENESLETDDFIFYGTTLWSKLNENAFSKMNDQFSFSSRQEVLDIHQESVNKLETFINEYKSDKQLVVITHHMPSFKLIDKEYEKFTSLNAGFASELDHLIRDPVSYWVFGHTHKPSNTVINGVKLICNPHGYPKERYARTDYPDCTIGEI